MLKVYSDIGKITVGIQTLTKGQEELGQGQKEVEQKISGLHRTVADLVTTDDCEARHAELAAAIGEEDPTASYQPSGILHKAAENAGNITKILTLISAVAIGLWAAHKFVVRVEAAVERNTGQQTQVTKKLMHRLDTPQPPQVVYVPVPVPPDAGVRRRRPRRRPARRPRTKRATPDTR
jgi:hypothetical protein